MTNWSFLSLLPACALLRHKNKSLCRCVQRRESVAIEVGLHRKKLKTDYSLFFFFTVIEWKNCLENFNQKE